MNKTILHKPAFSLIEVIVAFSVLVMVIIACTNLLVSIIRSNTANENRLVAYGLAQEGLEAIRNIRDSNWLLGADFQGKVGDQCLWQGNWNCLPGSVGDKKYFTIDSYPTDISSNSSASLDDIQVNSPWILNDVTPVNETEPLPGSITLCKTTLGNSSDVWYRPCSASLNQNQTPSLFSRFIEVTPERYVAAGAGGPGSGDATVKKYLVSSVVQWEEQSRKIEVRLTTEITDWKGGPL